MTKPKDWKKEFYLLKEEFDDLWRKYNIANHYSPPIWECKKCGDYYAEGYVCFCGHDSSFDNEIK